MKKVIFMDKYPVYTLELEKNEVSQTNILQIVEYFKNKIENHPVAKHIATFDHYEHTLELQGEINPDILGAKNVIFCFGKQLPSSKVLAVRPRSIGICELKDKYIIEFIEAPNEQLHEVMENWAKELKI